MASLENSVSGNYTDVPYSGEIVITPTTMSVQAMDPVADAPGGPYTVDGYEAFYGTASIDAKAETFSVNDESAAVRDLIGQTPTRNYKVSNDTLVLTPTDPAKTWRVTYGRINGE